MLANDAGILRVAALMNLLRSIRLSWSEALVLLHVYWRGCDLRELSDLTGLPPGELGRARRSLLSKVARALGYLDGEVERVALPPSAEELGRRAAAMRESGRTWKEIAAALGVSEATAVAYWRQAGMPARPALTTRQVAERFGVSLSTVTRWVADGRLVPMHPSRQGQPMTFDPAAVEALARCGAMAGAEFPAA